MSHDVDNKTPPPPLRQTTNDRGVCEQTTVPGCAQTTLAALAKRQFGGLKRHLCHTLELGKELQKNLSVSDRPKIMEKFSQLADENGHFLLPGVRGGA